MSAVGERKHSRNACFDFYGLFCVGQRQLVKQPEMKGSILHLLVFAVQGTTTVGFFFCKQPPVIILWLKNGGLCF